MPLDKSGSKESIGRNISTEKAAGKPQDQAVAIALETARRAGGDVPAKHSKETYETLSPRQHGHN